MDIRLNSSTFFVFDLDDTLYQEIDFLRSAYRAIATTLKPALKVSIYNEMLERYRRQENVFDWILEQYRENLGTYDGAWLIRTYREHIPEIRLSAEVTAFINQVRALGIPAGLITDGRSVTQRNKLKTLGLLDLFKEIIISEEFGSEKPDKRNYLHFAIKYPGSDFYYFGDNTRKDFVTPLQLGWTTICIRDRGENIHEQQFGGEGSPEYVVGGFDEINLIKNPG
jgi:putative hydrolase of the HAD superfamily